MQAWESGMAACVAVTNKKMVSVCRALRPGSAGSARSSDASSRGSSKPISRANSQQLDVEQHSSSQALQQASQALHAYAAGASSPSSTSGPLDSPLGAGAASSSSHGHGQGGGQVPSRLGRQQQQAVELSSLGSDTFNDDPAMMELYTSALQRPRKGGSSPTKKS